VRLLKLVEKADLEAVCIDMNARFYAVCRATLPGVPVVIDRFHVVDEVQEALKRVINRVKREVAAGDPQAAKHLWDERWVLLAAEEKLDQKVVKKRKRAQERQQKAEAHKQAKRKGKSDRAVLGELWALDARLEQGWRLKESLRRLYEQATAEAAEQHLSEWMEQAARCGLSEFNKLGQTYQRWQEPILAYFQLSAPDKTSGKTERQVEVIKDLEKARHKFDKCENLEGVVFLRQDRVPGLPLSLQFSP
jgi:transposase